ncbi:MAG: GAF domain-containing protein [Halobacteriales archaeon]|nr:GAF domain-containing protein [Halobacteriales archaeon]
MSRTVLYAEVDTERRTAVADAFGETADISTVGVESLRAAREQFAAERMDAIVTGATLTDGTGDDLAALARATAPQLPLFLYADGVAGLDVTDHDVTFTERYDARRLSPPALAKQLGLALEGSVASPHAEREAARLAALDGYDIDAARVLPFDRLTRLAADSLGVPVSFLSFLTDCDQFLLGSTGIDRDRFDRANSICTHGLTEPSHFAVEDLLADPRFATIDDLLDAGMRSYLGVPLRTPGGESLGMFCVMDTEPREYGERDVQRLRGFARTAMDMLALQRPDPLDSAFDS